MNKGYRIHKYLFLFTICIIVTSLLLPGCGHLPPTPYELIKDFYSDRVEVRESATEALVEMGAPAVEPLITVLEGEDALAQEWAAGILVEIGTPAVEPLIAVLENGHSLVRESTTEALGKIGDARAVEPLIAVLENEDSLARKSATEALAKIGDARAVEPIIAVLEREDALAREWAAEALVEMGALDNTPFLIQLRAAEVLGNTTTSEAKQFAERFFSPFRLLSTGYGVGEMAAYDGTAPHPIMVLNSAGGIHQSIYKLPSKWVPTSIDDIELVAFIGENEQVTIETCRYSGGRTIYRKGYQTEVRLIEAQTGRVVADKVFLGSPPRECELVSSFDPWEGSSKVYYGSIVQFVEIQRWLSTYVEH
ncbi:HEAT repeat domain-containing protein [Chloroflexota bacterium]